LRLKSAGIDLGILLNVINLFFVSDYIQMILSEAYFW
jgi:hypothetical protein